VLSATGNCRSLKLNVYESAAEIFSVLMALALPGFVMLPAADPVELVILPVVVPAWTQFEGVACSAIHVVNVPTPWAPGVPVTYMVKIP